MKIEIDVEKDLNLSANVMQAARQRLPSAIREQIDRELWGPKAKLRAVVHQMIGEEIEKLRPQIEAMRPQITEQVIEALHRSIATQTRAVARKIRDATA